MNGTDLDDVVEDHLLDVNQNSNVDIHVDAGHSTETIT